MKRRDETLLFASEILEVVNLIPYGKVATYGQIAKLAGLPKHARYVGFVLKQLDANSDIPWHRVINSQGKISLQKANNNGENIQHTKLLEEGVVILNSKINLKMYQWNLNYE
jgi:methylated-DNA-protein-cysteine methyltransferase related protein